MDINTLVHAFRHGDVLGPKGQPIRIKKAVLTRRSVLLMSEQTVLKLRRPREVAGFDQTKVSIRYGMTSRERWIGQKIAPDTYLEELTLVSPLEGPLQLVAGQHEGEAVLAMRRWPAAQQASELVFSERYGVGLFRGLMQAMARFHVEALTHTDGPYGSASYLQQRVRRDIARLEVSGLEFELKSWEAFKVDIETDLVRCEATLNHRLLEGRVRECHGGLYLEHIFIDPEDVTRLAVIDPEDGLDEARILDVGEEMMRLALELELARGKSFADQVLDIYASETQDHTLRKVGSLFRKLAILHAATQALDEAADPEGESQSFARAQALMSWALSS